MSNQDYNTMSAGEYSAEWRDANPESSVLLRMIGLFIALFGPALTCLFLLSEYTNISQALQFFAAGFLVPVGWFLAIGFRN